MRRLIIVVVAISVVLLGPLTIVRAQEATPEAASEAGLPIAVLGALPSSLAPGHGLVLARATFPAGFSEPHRHIHPFDYVAAVESGSFAFTIEAGTLLLMRSGSTEPEPAPLGEEIVIGPGDSFAGNPEVVWVDERVVGDEPAVLLGTFLAPEGAPEAEYVGATPTP